MLHWTWTLVNERPARDGIRTPPDAPIAMWWMMHDDLGQGGHLSRAGTTVHWITTFSSLVTLIFRFVYLSLRVSICSYLLGYA